MYKVKNISKTFIKKNQKIQALKEVSFSVEKGEVYGLIGLSGAGKSTLLRCLNYLEQPDDGEVYFEGKKLSSLKEVELRKERQDIAMIFQHFNLFPSRTVYENVEMPLAFQNLSPKDKREKVESVLHYLGIYHRKDAYPSTLSGGEAQRVAIARAIVSEPKVLLCDEPTSALDPQTTGNILRLLQDLNKRLNLTLIIITHEMEVIESICDKVAVMKDGRIIESGKIENVLLRTQELETQKLLQIPQRVRRVQNQRKAGHALVLINENYLDFTQRDILSNILDLEIKHYHGKKYVSYLLEVPQENLSVELQNYEGALYCEVMESEKNNAECL